MVHVGDPFWDSLSHLCHFPPLVVSLHLCSGWELMSRAGFLCSATLQRKGIFRCQPGVSIPACLHSPCCPKGMTGLGFSWLPACGGFPCRMGHGSTAGAMGLTDPELGAWGVANPLISRETLDVSGTSSSPNFPVFQCVFISSHPKPWAYCDFLPLFSGSLVLSCHLKSGARSPWQQELPGCHCAQTGALGGACSSIAAFEVWWQHGSVPVPPQGFSCLPCARVSWVHRNPFL